MAHARPETVLVINNNPEGKPGRYTPQLIERLREAGLRVHQAQSVEEVDKYAHQVGDGTNDVGLIVSCGSPVVLTEPVDISAHVTKTTAAMLHFPNAPVVGICYGMQLLAQLYGGTLIPMKETAHTPGHWEHMRRLDAPSRILGQMSKEFTQWASNYIFVERIPSRFVATAVDSSGRVMTMEHAREHVYCFQFHPEVLGEGVGRAIIDGIAALVGQNRRVIDARLFRSSESQARAWNCSTQCSLRRAVRDATRIGATDNGAQKLSQDKGDADVGSASTSHHMQETMPHAKAGGVQIDDQSGVTLASRLAAARRHAMEALRRHHCRNGCISVQALEDAIATMCSVAGTRGNSCAALNEQGPTLPVGVPLEEGNVCNLHDADLRLRGVVKEVLRMSKCVQMLGCSKASGSSSRTTSVGSTRTHSSVAGPKGDIQGSSGSYACNRLVTPPMRAKQVTQGSDENDSESRSVQSVGMHEADLHLREAVKDLLRERGSGQELGRVLAAQRRSALAEFRKQIRGAGSVDGRDLEQAVLRLRETALTVEP